MAVVAGTEKALDHGLAPLAPALFRADSELYAVPALAGAFVVGIASTVDADSAELGAGVAAVVFVVRVLALQRHWRGPRARATTPGRPARRRRTPPS